MLDENRVPPNSPAGGTVLEQRHEAPAVDRRRRRQAGERFERGRQVDVLGERRDRGARADAGTVDDERDVDVGVESGHLSGLETVLTHVETVVGAEHEVRVVGEPVGDELLPETADQAVDCLDGVGPGRMLVDRVNGVGVEAVGDRSSHSRVADGVAPIERRRPRRFNGVETMRVAAGGDERGVRRERGDLDNERMARTVVARRQRSTGPAGDLRRRQAGEDVREIRLRNGRSARGGDPG